MSDFQRVVRELEKWLDDGCEVLRFVEVLWCAGEVDAAARVWTLACARGDAAVLDDIEAECALDSFEGLLQGLGPLTTRRAGG